jgi:hypothetical protein
MFHYPPAVWNEEEQEGWENDDYESYDTGYEHALNDEEEWDEGVEEEWDDLGMSGPVPTTTSGPPSFAQQQAMAQVKPLTLQQQQVQQHAQQQRGQQQLSQYAQDPQQQQQQQQAPSQYAGQDRIIQQQTSNQSLQQQTSNSSLRQQGSNPSLRAQGSREGLSPTDARSVNSSGSTSPAHDNSPREGGAGIKVFDPEALDAVETRKISVTPTVAREQQYAKDTQASATTAVAAGQAVGGQGPLLPSQVLAQ